MLFGFGLVTSQWWCWVCQLLSVGLDGPAFAFMIWLGCLAELFLWSSVVCWRLRCKVRRVLEVWGRGG